MEKKNACRGNSRYSKVVTCCGRQFRYDRDYAVVEYVGKLNAEMERDNEEWIQKYGHPLWEVEEGMVVYDTIGLSRENWDDPEAREEYLEGWCFDMDEMTAEFIRHYAP